MIQAGLEKNILKKVVETLAGLKERRTFAPAIEKTTTGC